MHSLFTPADTLDASTYLHSVVYPNNSFALEWLMPVTGLQDNGQPITPPGFDNNYGLYLMVDASGFLGQTTPTPVAEQFTSINVTLWADPKNDAGTASSTVANGASFSGPTSNAIYMRDPNGYVVELSASTGVQQEIMDPSVSKPHEALARWQEAKPGQPGAVAR